VADVMVKVQLPAPFLKRGELKANVPLLVVVPDWVAVTEPLQVTPKATEPTIGPDKLLDLVVMVMLHL
jgi:hypothetical protein